MWLIAMMTATYTMQSVVRVLLSIYIVWLGLFQFFRLRVSIAHSRDQPAPSRLAVS